MSLLMMFTFLSTQFLSSISLMYPQSPLTNHLLKVKPSVFCEKWSSSERLPSHFITALQWGYSKHNSKQQNYYFPSDGNRSLFKNNVNNVKCPSVRSPPHSVNITLFPSGCSMFLTMPCTFLTLSLLTSVFAVPQIFKTIFLLQKHNY